MCAFFYMYKSKSIKSNGNSVDGLMFIPLWDILKLYCDEDQEYNDVLIYFKNFSCFKEIPSTIYLSLHHTWRRRNHNIILEDWKKLKDTLGRCILAPPCSSLVGGWQWGGAPQNPHVHPSWRGTSSQGTWWAWPEEQFPCLMSCSSQPQAEVQCWHSLWGSNVHWTPSITVLLLRLALSSTMFTHASAFPSVEGRQHPISPFV